MLSLIVWLLALYGACVVAWKVISTLWRRNQRNNLTRVQVIVMVQNGADCIEGMLTPLLKGSLFLKREFEIMVFDLESKDETFRILEKLAEEAANLSVQCCDEEEAVAHVRYLLQSSDGLVCYVDLRNLQNPRDVGYVLSEMCGYGM